MNRVYKVIWSKAKHCYVVTSEIARSVTKSASSACSAGRKGAAVLAMTVLLFTAGGVLGEAANVTDIEYGKTADVIMVTKDDGTTTPITINDVYHAMKANSDGDGLIINENYVKNADARVSTDGEYVKKDKKVGENLSALDAQVKTNTKAVVEVVTTVGELGGKYTALDGKVQAEVADRKAADQNNLKVGDDGVISKVTGNDGTTPSAVNTLVLNKDGENQITLSDKGIKVGTNSTVIASDGVFAGGDTATDAKAALNANGSIKGANGAFTVDENGNVASKATITGETVTDGKGASMSNGTVTGGTVTSTGNISALGDIHANGAITGASASFIGDIHANGAIQGKSISDGTATMKNGDITGVKNLSAETITTHGDLTVNGKLNMDEIYMTKDGIVGDNNVKSSNTKVAAGEITSYKDAISTKDGSEKESAFDYDENGTSTWAKATDADGKKNKSTLTVEGKGIKSIATDGKNNASTNLSNKGFNTFASDGGKNKTYTKQTAESLTSQIGDDGKVKSVMNADGITNITGDNTVTSDTNGTTFENKAHNIAVKEGTVKNTTISGNTIETGQAKMDYADVTKDLSVGGNAAVDGNTTLGKEGEDTILTVNSTSTFNKDVTMKENATVEKDLTVNGESTLTGDVTMGSNATVEKDLTVNGTSTLTGDVTMESNATVTKDLTVKGASEFVYRADFRDNVFMDENLTVAKETRTDTLYVDHDGYVGGNLNVEGNIETHDAVLSADSRQVVTGRQLYQTNERVDRLDNRIKKVGANAAALAALRPGDFNPDDKFSIAAGFGSYRNANAAALGLFYRPNENVLLSLGTSFGDGENMVNAGVSVKFGRGKSMAERRKEMADEVSSMRDEMRSQDERIAELEEMLKKQSELIEKLSKES